MLQEITQRFSELTLRSDYVSVLRYLNTVVLTVEAQATGSQTNRQTSWTQTQTLYYSGCLPGWGVPGFGAALHCACVHEAVNTTHLPVHHRVLV